MANTMNHGVCFGKRMLWGEARKIPTPVCRGASFRLALETESTYSASVVLTCVKGIIPNDFYFDKQYEPYDDAYVAERFRFTDPGGRRWAEQNFASPNPRPNLTYPFTAKNSVTYQPPRNGWKYTIERMRELDDQNGLHYPQKENGRLRLKNYFDERKGVPVQDIWAELGAIGGTSGERIGYPTQKPLALLERIVLASSREGDLVLDPFCGCGTAIEAAEQHRRQWIGIDITYLAIHVIERRLLRAFGPTIKHRYKLFGRPKDADDANGTGRARLVGVSEMGRLCTWRSTEGSSRA
jgi:hypothetical protein